jgi:hypothetical protein
MENEIEELEASVDEADQTMASFPPGPEPEHGHELARFGCGSRRILFLRSRDGDGRQWPAWKIAIWCRLDSGAWVPVRGAYVNLRVRDLLGFARTVATAVRNANTFAKARAVEDHMRATAGHASEYQHLKGAKPMTPCPQTMETGPTGPLSRNEP